MYVCILVHEMKNGFKAFGVKRKQKEKSTYLAVYLVINKTVRNTARDRHTMMTGRFIFVCLRVNLLTLLSGKKKTRGRSNGLPGDASLHLYNS